MLETTFVRPEKFCFPKKPEMISSIQSIENYFIQIAFILYDDILERNQDLFGNFSFVLIQQFYNGVRLDILDKDKRGRATMGNDKTSRCSTRIEK